MNEKTRSILIKVGRGCHWVAQSLFALVMLTALLMLAVQILK